MEEKIKKEEGIKVTPKGVILTIIWFLSIVIVPLTLGIDKFEWVGIAIFLSPFIYLFVRSLKAIANWTIELVKGIPSLLGAIAAVIGIIALVVGIPIVILFLLRAFIHFLIY